MKVWIKFKCVLNSRVYWIGPKNKSILWLSFQLKTKLFSNAIVFEYSVRLNEPKPRVKANINFLQIRSTFFLKSLCTLLSCCCIRRLFSVFIHLCSYCLANDVPKAVQCRCDRTVCSVKLCADFHAVLALLWLRL